MNRVLLRILGLVGIGLAIAALFWLLTALSPVSISLACDPPKLAQQSSASSISLKIYIDGTPSMAGYAAIKDSRYVRTLIEMDRAAGVVAAQRRYFRFGIVSREMKGKQSSVDAQRVRFYKADPGFEDTRIQAAINPTDNSSKGELTLVVTDLYQTLDQNLDQASARKSPGGKDKSAIDILKTNYLQKGQAVGILAIRSEFNGMIYDIKIKDDDRLYKTVFGKENTYHPFYIMMLGERQQIVSYYEQLRKRLPFVKGDQFVIFDASPPMEPLTLIEEKQEVPGITPQSILNDGKAQMEAASNKNLTLLRLTKDYQEDSGLKQTLTYKPQPYGLSIKSFSPQIKAQQFSSSEKKLVNSSQSIQFSDWQIQPKDSVVNVSSILTFQALKDPGIYTFEVNIHPNELESPPRWWQDWSFAEGEPFTGAKTYDLQQFMTSLSDTTLALIQTSPTPIGRLCYGIHKENPSNPSS